MTTNFFNPSLLLLFLDPGSEKVQICSYFVQQHPYYCTWYVAVKISIDIGVRPESLYPDLRSHCTIFK